MRKLIAANWKENPQTEKKAIALFRAVANARSKKGEVVIAPPFIYLEKIAELHRRGKKLGAAIGAQDAFWEERGAYTSEVGPKMLRSLGVRYVIVGHSERRKWLKETDAMINKKIKLVLKDGLWTILCVGEGLPIRKKGSAAAQRFVEGQLKKDLSGVKKAMARQVIIAYEPIWAIGTGRYDKPTDAVEMAGVIKRYVKKTKGFTPRVLYGGSVSSKNVHDYVQYKDIDGALVGGASLRGGEFKKIIKII